MKNLVVCCDGTWNTPDQSEHGVPSPTNVVRLFNCVTDRAADGVPQEKYYHPGVGTGSNWWDKLAGGGTGIGLSRNVMSAYKWLAERYEPGDRIYLFGFSRGAYTVRSAAGMLASKTCGLLKLDGLDDPTIWARVERAYQRGYRERKDRPAWAGGWEFHEVAPGDSRIPVHFLGVWDTVGALGIPDELAILNLLDDTRRYAFHDTKLNDRVRHGCHAVALDERRLSFAPTLWTGIEHRPEIKQVWFPGVHSDVGGGYLETGLSDGALEWMMDEAAAQQLGLHPQMRQQVRSDPQGVLHDSRTGLYRAMRAQPRNLPELDRRNCPALLHRSVFSRLDNPPITQAPYHRSLRLAPGEERVFPIYAGEPWNETGLFLGADEEYEFTATGEWMDRDIKCGPTGTRDGKFQAAEIAHLAGSLWGKVEGAFKKLTANAQADFRGTKRVEDLPWFALVGFIANGGEDDEGRPILPEIIPIRDGINRTIRRPGYLYCFANDAWNFYDNNRGSVRLTVRRIR